MGAILNKHSCTGTDHVHHPSLTQELKVEHHVPREAKDKEHWPGLYKDDGARDLRIISFADIERDFSDSKSLYDL